jgi:hypothetical protein
MWPVVMRLVQAFPRTGEIIESDVIWYHNHLRSYRNRYLLETGAAILQQEH